MNSFALHDFCRMVVTGRLRLARLAFVRLGAALAAVLFCSLASALPPVSIIQGFAVTNRTRTDGVLITYNISNATCPGIDVQGLYRDGEVIADGWAPYLDTTAMPGVTYNYYVAYSNCDGDGYSTAIKPGMRAYPPAAFPATISATDGASTTQVTVSGVVPSQSVCGAASAQFYVYRDNVQVFTTSIPPTAGIAPATPFSFVDTPPYPGHNNYYEAVVSSNCDLTNNTSGDTGWAGTSLDGSYGYAPPATSLTATNGTYPDHVDLQAVFPPMSMTSTVYRIFRDGSAISAAPLTTSLFLNTTVNYTDTSPPPGPHTYSISLEGASPNALVPGHKYLVYGVSPKVSAVGSILLAVPVIQNVVATDGTVLDAVSISWDAAPVANYQVLRCPNVVGEPTFAGPGNSGALSIAGTPCTLLGSPVPSSPFVDSLPGSTHVLYRYAVYGVAADGVTFGPVSTSDGGYPDRAPTSAVASGSIPYGSIAPVAVTPVVTDVNPTELFSFTTPVALTARGGSVSVVGPTIQYTPPATPFAGSDTFSFIAADKAGATVAGSGTIMSGCSAPTITAVAVSPSRVLPNAGFRVLVSYGNNNCPHSTTASFDVTGPSSVASQNLAVVPPALAGNITIDFPGIAYPGAYNMTVTLRDTVDATQSTRSVGFVVSTFQLPTVTTPAPVLEFIETATLSVGSTPDCTLTTSDTAAAADPSLCLVTVSGLPATVVVVPAALLPTWSGPASPAGSFPIAVLFEQYDNAGVKHTLGTRSTTMVVQALSSMSFSSPTPVPAKIHLRSVSVNVSQTAGPSCLLITDRPTAIAAAAAGTRRCLLSIPTIPTGFVPTPTGIAGTPHSLVIPAVPWTVSIYDKAGIERTVSSGNVDFSVAPLDLTYRLQSQPTAPMAGVSNSSIQLAPSATDSCPLTMDSAVANNPASSVAYCLVEWGALPPGISQATAISIPMLRGIFTSAGAITVPFTMSVFDATGTKYTIFTGSPTLTVAPAPTPSVVLANMHVISPDVYYVPLDGGYYGNIANCPSCGAVTVTQTIAGDSTPKIMSILSSSGRQSLVGTPATLWQQRAATLRVALANAPSYFAEKAITLVSVPPTTAKVLLTIPGPDVPDNAPVALTATVGVFGSTGFAYDAAKLGAWRVRFGTQDANGNFTPLTGYIDTDGSGVASGTVDPASQLVMKLVAVAEPVSPVPGYTASISSFVRVIRVVKGTPVSGHLEVSASDGPAPLLTVIKVVYDSRADQVANGGVVWYRSDDGGATYSQIPDFTNPVLVTRLAEGSAMFKVGFINHNTSVTSESPAVTVTAFGVPQVVLSGDIYSFPGTTATVTAVARRPDGTVIPGAVFDWSVAPRATTNVPPAPIATGTGPTATFSSAVAGVFTVKYRARLATSPDADPRSWGERNQQVIFDGAQKPNVRVTGPIRVEVGKTYVYTANVTAPFPITSSPLSLGGQWSLPDGSTVSGTTLNWTPTAADLAAGVSGRVTYSAWIVGYEATTTASAYQAVTLWRYVFPTWHAVTQLGATVAPAGVTVALIADNPLLVSTLEGLTYTWSVPAGIRVNGTPVSKLSGIADFGGTYPVDVTVSDTRGNSQTVSSVVTVNNPAPYVMTVAVSKISRWSHAPLIVGFTPKVTGGHPSDSIVTWQYFVDGVQQPALPNRAGVQITFDSPGTYSVESRGLSRMGATVSQTVVANVPANIAPSCTVDAVVSSNRTQVALRANCADPDGAIVRYDWSVNGVPRTGVAGVWTYIKPTSTSFPITFDLTVTDDGGGTSSASATAN